MREGPKDIIEKEITELEHYLKKYSPLKYQPFMSQIRGKYRLNLLIRVESNSWPKETPNEESGEMALLEVLKSLPPRFIVDIEPNSII